MFRTVSEPLALLLLSLPLTAVAQSSSSDALKLLDGVSKQYQTATSYHIESVRETRATTELSSNWSKWITSAYEEPGDRYRFEGRSGSGDAFLVSDGTTEWEFRPTFDEYTKRPPESYQKNSSHVGWPQDLQIESAAIVLRRELAITGDSLKSAHLLPNETIQVGDRTIPCFVIGFGSDDFRKSDASYKSQTKMWIDRTNKTIVKEVSSSDSSTPWTPKGAPPHPRQTHSETTITYPVVELNKPIPDSVFTFTPPSGAVLVETLSNPNAPLPSPAANAAAPALPDMVGMRAPRIILEDPESLDLRTFRGKPVLIDQWATWCVPCLEEMPLIDHIFKDTKEAGLAVIAVDNDENPDNATALLKRKNYAWKNYHAGLKGGVRIPNVGIPLIVLIDADGKIAYSHSGANDEPGLLSAIGKLGPAYATALAGEK